MPAPALELRGVTKRFGGVLANDGVSFAVAAGTIHALVGENGAGKSTAMRIAYGIHAPDQGEVAVNGMPRRFAGPQDAIRCGVGMVQQHFALVDTMTAAENIVLGAEPGRAWAIDRAGASARVAAWSRELGLAVEPAARVADLSLGERQRVELLKPLYRRARLLILDEPTAMLTPQETAGLFAVLRRLRERGCTVVLITHKLSEVLAVSDEVTVMRAGRVVTTRPTAGADAAGLTRLIVGRELPPRVPKAPARPGAPVLELRELTVLAAAGGKRLDGVSLTVRAGEIVGIAGVEGNGQTELIATVAGLGDPAAISGTVTLAGLGAPHRKDDCIRPSLGTTPHFRRGAPSDPAAAVSGAPPLAGLSDPVPVSGTMADLAGVSARRRKELGIAHVPEDRQRHGLLLDFSLSENSILGVHYRPPAAAGPFRLWLDRPAIAQRAASILERFEVRPATLELPARALSGGNQQKLVLGRELSLPPRLLLAAQPTRGVDLGGIELIHRQLVALRDAGCAVLLVSSDLEEVMTLADRMLVLYRGRVAGEVDPARATLEEVGWLMTGGAPTTASADAAPASQPPGEPPP